MADLAASAIGRESSPRIVYVLDDDALVRDGISRLLSRSGYEPHGFSAPAQMLDKVKQAPPEVIVLDLALGQSDAIDVMRQLADCKFEGKILLVSGRDEATLDVQRIGERHRLAMPPAPKRGGTGNRCCTMSRLVSGALQPKGVPSRVRH